MRSKYNKSKVKKFHKRLLTEIQRGFQGCVKARHRRSLFSYTLSKHRKGVFHKNK
ncbi:hypothetical protein FZC66_03410 [Priestia megaterium]|nr:hypothetical protein FZC66_03410 [Priestia megaterium]